MRSTDDCFSSSYLEAAEKFWAHAPHAAASRRHVHPSLGALGEQLSTDMLWFGTPSVAALVVVTSGVHGVEGFAGSGIQIALLEDAELLATIRDSNVGLLLVHAVNPHGFSHMRRVDEHNVDINRNFVEDWTSPHANPRYARVHPHLVPTTWPPSDENEAALRRILGEPGFGGLQAAIQPGQYSHRDGLFFGGSQTSWASRTLMSIFEEYAAGSRALRWIDLHTGLGEFGYGERIYLGPNDADRLRRARTTWGAAVTSMYEEGSSTSAEIHGSAWEGILRAIGRADMLGIALEYGTRPVPEVLAALRYDQWHASHASPDFDSAPVKQAMMDAFYGDDRLWRMRVVAQAKDAVLGAAHSLK
jgi:hypothetical protein